MKSVRSKRIRNRWNLRNQLMVRSTTHRVFPGPLSSRMLCREAIEQTYKTFLAAYTPAAG
jgi:hypothetical protein